MKPRGFLVFTACVLAVSSCGGDDGPAQYSDPDTRIDVAVGTEFEVVLESNASTGYSWDLQAPIPPGVLALVDSRYLAPETDQVGVPGQQVFEFRAVGDGSTFIQLWYIRPFDDPPDPEDFAQFEVIVGTGVPPQTVDPSDTDPPASTIPDDEDAISVTELITGGDAENVAVRSLLFDDGTGLVLCEVLAESFPPLCIGVRVPIANPDVVDADFTQQGEIRWTDRMVVLAGTMTDGTFTVRTE